MLVQAQPKSTRKFGKLNSSNQSDEPVNCNGSECSARGGVVSALRCYLSFIINLRLELLMTELHSLLLSCFMFLKVRLRPERFEI